MKCNEAGRALIKLYEGLRLQAYRCSAGVWTIGYGHTGASVRADTTITEHQAEVIFDSDLEKFEHAVTELCPGVNENQFAALVSFAFNLGITALANSTLRKKILRGEDASFQFARWCQAAGTYSPGLYRRRLAEAELFLRPV